MLLMIWVNDFWTLSEVPKWLSHAAPYEDYLGFSDIIFPLFLFIVGLSIPFAIQNRISKNETVGLMAKHIVIRAVSLIIIGVFMLNYETHHQSMGLGKSMWCLLMALGVLLVWMQWKKSPIPMKWHRYLQLAGIALLVFLAIAYKGGPTGEGLMKTQWWGILGLIGWAYAINALAYLFSKGNLIFIIVLWLAFNLLSALGNLGFLTGIQAPFNYFSTWYMGSIPAFTAAGMLASLIFKKVSKDKLIRALSILVLLGVASIVYGLSTRYIWGISKVPGTPSWVAVCTGIGFLSFVLFYFVADIKKKTSWAKIILPAGTATLTCYLIPYFTYPLRTLTGVQLPQVLNTGSIGLLSSLCFALLVVVFTGWLQKKGFTLKL